MRSLDELRCQTTDPIPAVLYWANRHGNLALCTDSSYLQKQTTSYHFVYQIITNWVSSFYYLEVPCLR